MNTIRIVFGIIVVSFISFDIPEATATNDGPAREEATARTQAIPGSDSKSAIGKMMFWRHMTDGPACLEYSWVPEGKRRVVRLGSGVRENWGVGPMSHASHVQVYSLSNNGRAGVKKWQFPPGQPHSGKVVGATVEVRGMEVVGTVYYNDGTSALDRHTLDPAVHTCPEVPKKK